MKKKSKKRLRGKKQRDLNFFVPPKPITVTIPRGDLDAFTTRQDETDYRLSTEIGAVTTRLDQQELAIKSLEAQLYILKENMLNEEKV